MRAPLSLLLAAGLASLGPASHAPVTAQNLGFEQATDSAGRRTPTGWIVRGLGYEIALDSTVRFEGRASLRSRHAAAAYSPASFGLASQLLAVGDAAGRSLRLSGWIRTEEVRDGYAGLWMRVDGEDGRMLVFDNMLNRGARGTTDWTRFEITLPVDSSAGRVLFGVLHPGSGTAWFDSLDLQVVGPARPRRYEAPPRPAEDLGRSLSDAELAVARDADEMAEDTAVAAWVRANAHPVRSLGADDFRDLRFLAPLLTGKRIVQLGESGHGVREFDLAKVRLVRYLHEELGYDVIAFESSQFGCDRAGRHADSLSAEQLMRACIFAVWQTEEVRPLFEYVKRTRSTAHPLVLAGFDVQVSGGEDRRRPQFFRSVVGALDTAYAQRVFAWDSSFAANARGRPAQQYALRVRDSLAARYDSLAAWLRANAGALAPQFTDDPAAPVLARQTALSLAQYVRVLAAGPGVSGTAIRDRGMADNLDVLLDELHPGRKVIVWAHNYHIQHRGYGTASPVASNGMVRTMGTYVAERHRAELYTVGLYMYRGSAAANDRTQYPIRPAPAQSLEAIVRQAPWRYAFLDLSRAPRVPATEWMFRSLTAREWGVTPLLIVPRDEYDGILLIDRSWPPTYLR